MTCEDGQFRQVCDAGDVRRPEVTLPNGPFVINPDLVGNAQMTLDKNPTGYLADTIPYELLCGVSQRVPLELQ